MILLLIVLSVLGFAVLNVFAKNKLQTGLSLVLGLVFVASVVALMANLTYHFGMEKETTAKTTPLVSSANNENFDLLLYQPLGDGTEKIYLYKTDADQEEPKQTGTDKVTNVVETGADSAQLETKTTRWVYKSDLSRFLFGIADNDGQYVSRTNTFSLPDSWEVLSVDQAKKLASLAKEQADTMKTQGQAYVQENMQAALMADPTMDEAAQKAKIAELTEAYQKEAMAKLLEEAKK